jgi:sortase A
MQKKLLKITIYALQAGSLLIILYLAVAPFLPEIMFRLRGTKIAEISNSDSGNQSQDLSFSTSSEQTAVQGGAFPQAGYSVSKNRLIIAKIGVNAPIVEAKGEWGLDRGAWRMPDSSTPDKGGNTVISGHRFKYLPPNNTTFYLFHKLSAGDKVKVEWEGKEYDYSITEKKNVDKTDMSILEKTASSTLTLFTCDPIYSQEHRLVVIAKPD